MTTSAQRAEIVEAINRERARCVRILEAAMKRLDSESYYDVRAMLTEKLDHIRNPYRVRVAEKRAAVPQRMRRCCGICGGDDHTAPRHDLFIADDAGSAA